MFIGDSQTKVSSFEFQVSSGGAALSYWHLAIGIPRGAVAGLMFLASCGGESNSVCQLEPSRKLSCIRARL
jgi:hypothetical protein